MLKLMFVRIHDWSAAGFTEWPFMSVHQWGEYPIGEWKLEIKNRGHHTSKFSLLKMHQ